ncbi:CHAP domain-containing protein [Chryseobacterium limigenitum]|nr:CHAP domain-containing protein [Chryseobacterium limigenitum]
MIYTIPMYNIKTSYTIRETLGTVNGTIVKASNPNLLNKYDLDVQCTEFCCRYYAQVYGKNIINPNTTNGGHAKDWYNTASVKGLQKIPIGNTPRVGDILCMEGGGGNGHVAIIIEVGTSLIKVAQQNAGIPSVNASNYDTHWQHAIGGGLLYNSSTKIITPPNGYTVEGLLRL